MLTNTKRIPLMVVMNKIRLHYNLLNTGLHLNIRLYKIVYLIYVLNWRGKLKSATSNMSIKL